LEIAVKSSHDFFQGNSYFESALWKGGWRSKTKMDPSTPDIKGGLTQKVANYRGEHLDGIHPGKAEFTPASTPAYRANPRQ
jgi:hypothetical protein